MNETYNKKKALQYLRKYCEIYGASESEMLSIAQRESENNPLTGLHDDGMSYGWMGVTPVVETEFLNFTGERADRKTLEGNVKMACWYWGKRIPQMLKYFDRPNTLRNRVICYNAGINYVVKPSELPAITISYIAFMEGQKKKNRLSWGLPALFAGWIYLK